MSPMSHRRLTMSSATKTKFKTRLFWMCFDSQYISFEQPRRHFVLSQRCGVYFRTINFASGGPMVLRHFMIELYRESDLFKEMNDNISLQMSRHSLTKTFVSWHLGRLHLMGLIPNLYQQADRVHGCLDFHWDIREHIYLCSLFNSLS